MTSISKEAADRILKEISEVAEKNPAGTWQVSIRSQAGLIFVREVSPAGQPGIRNEAQYNARRRLG